MEAPAVSRQLKNFGIGVLAFGVVVVDSISFFWSMAGDLLLVGALVAVTKIPTKR
jgi:hypothetical protein